MIVISMFDIPYEVVVNGVATTYQSPAVIFTAKALLMNTTMMAPETPFCGISDATWDWCQEMWALYAVGSNLQASSQARCK